MCRLLSLFISLGLPESGQGHPDRSLELPQSMDRASKIPDNFSTSFDSYLAPFQSEDRQLEQVSADECGVKFDTSVRHRLLPPTNVNVKRIQDRFRAQCDHADCYDLIWEFIIPRWCSYRMYHQNEELSEHDRLKAFARHYVYAVALNSAHLSFTVGMNQFFDWSKSQWNRYLTYSKTGNERDASRTKKVPKKKTTTTTTTTTCVWKVPPSCPNWEHFSSYTSVDWRVRGAVTPVKDQGSCGSCWAFSAIGALEGALKLQNDAVKGKAPALALSEQQLVDCDTERWSGRFPPNRGCNGGFMESAFMYVRDNGITAEKDYPYTVRPGQKCQKFRRVSDLTVFGFEEIQRGSENGLEEAVRRQPVSVAVDAGGPSFQFYTGGVYDSDHCSSQKLNHGMLAIGWGTEEDRTPYWLVKNSWSVLWGDGGYIKMYRGKNMCGIASEAVYPTVDEDCLPKPYCGGSG